MDVSGNSALPFGKAGAPSLLRELPETESRNPKPALQGIGREGPWGRAPFLRSVRIRGIHKKESSLYALGKGSRELFL